MSIFKKSLTRLSFGSILLLLFVTLPVINVKAESLYHVHSSNCSETVVLTCNNHHLEHRGENKLIYCVACNKDCYNTDVDVTYDVCDSGLIADRDVHSGFTCPHCGADVGYGDSKIQAHNYSEERLKCTLSTNSPIATADISVSESDWTNSNVSISVAGKALASGVSLSYSWDGGGTGNSISVSKNGTYSVTVQTGLGPNVRLLATVNNIDKTAPSLQLGKSTDKWIEEGLDIIANASDSESGIAGYSFNGGAFSTTNTFGIATNGTYTVAVMDKAGNITENSIEVGNIGRDPAVVAAEQEALRKAEAEKAAALAKAEQEARERAEQERLKAEAEKEKAEQERLKAEAEKEKAKQERLMAEAEAKKAEQERLKAEAEKQKAEAEWQNSEVQRQTAEQERIRTESEQKKSEDERLKAEAEKQKAEAEKQKAEAEKQKAEAEKQKAETEKQKAEAEKQKAEDEKTKALAEQEKIREASEKAKADAKVKKAEAEIKKAEATIKAAEVKKAVEEDNSDDIDNLEVTDEETVFDDGFSLPEDEDLLTEEEGFFIEINEDVAIALAEAVTEESHIVENQLPLSELESVSGDVYKQRISEQKRFWTGENILKVGAVFAVIGLFIISNFSYVYVSDNGKKKIIARARIMKESRRIVVRVSDARLKHGERYSVYFSVWRFIDKKHLPVYVLVENSDATIPLDEGKLFIY